jgi:hypothetical protein
MKMKFIPSYVEGDGFCFLDFPDVRFWSIWNTPLEPYRLIQKIIRSEIDRDNRRENFSIHISQFSDMKGWDITVFFTFKDDPYKMLRRYGEKYTYYGNHIHRLSQKPGHWIKKLIKRERGSVARGSIAVRSRTFPGGSIWTKKDRKTDLHRGYFPVAKRLLIRL